MQAARAEPSIYWKGPLCGLLSREEWAVAKPRLCPAFAIFPWTRPSGRPGGCATASDTVASLHAAVGQQVATGEDYPADARSTARCAQGLRSRARLQACDEAIMGVWWRWAGRLGPCCSATGRDAWWRKSAGDVVHQPTDHDRRRSNGGHRHLGKRRWDDLIQRYVEGIREREEPYQQAALDWTDWVATERLFADLAQRRFFADLYASCGRSARCV